MFDLTLDKIGTEKDKLNKLWTETKRDVFEMGQIKTYFDSELFTVSKEGPSPTKFLASKFHFLMRQLRFSISEGRRMFLDLEEVNRQIKRLEENKDYQDKIENEGKFLDIEIERLKARQDDTLIELHNQLGKTEKFEELRKQLIEMNGGKEFTNEQYQAEQTEYYQWFIADILLRDFLSAKTGLTPGSIEAHRMASGQSILPNGINGIQPLIYTENGEIDLPRIVYEALGREVPMEEILCKLQINMPSNTRDISSIQNNGKNIPLLIKR